MSCYRCHRGARSRCPLPALLPLYRAPRSRRDPNPTPPRRYNWHHFDTFNRDLARLLDEPTAPPGVELLDVARMSHLRPDGHNPKKKECLHYQLPSVVDAWNVLMMNQLIDRRPEPRA